MFPFLSSTTALSLSLCSHFYVLAFSFRKVNEAIWKQNEKLGWRMGMKESPEGI